MKTEKQKQPPGFQIPLMSALASILILANCAEYRLFHRLCIYQDRATEHLRPNQRKKKLMSALAIILIFLLIESCIRIEMAVGSVAVRDVVASFFALAPHGPSL